MIHNISHSESVRSIRINLLFVLLMIMMMSRKWKGCWNKGFLKGNGISFWNQQVVFFIDSIYPFLGSLLLWLINLHFLVSKPFKSDSSVIQLLHGHTKHTSTALLILIIQINSMNYTYLEMEEWNIWHTFGVPWANFKLF